MRVPPTLLGLFALSCDQPTSTGLACARTFFADADGDGHGDAASPITACLAPDGYTVPSDDCNDGDGAIHPHADELCNDLDDDCDGLADSLDPSLVEGAVFYSDADGDGFGDSTTGLHACEAPVDRVFHASDCDDTNASAHPYADEICDEVDNDCDGLVDLDDDSIVDAQTYYADADGDAFGDHEKSVVECFAPSAYYESVPGDCDDFDGDVNPDATEVWDDIDNDCDGLVDEDNAS